MHLNELWKDYSAVEQHPNVCSGELVFRATRIPIRVLFENLRDGASVEDFLEWFPGVPPQFIESVLEHEVALLKPRTA